jgi:hypothetical protein
VRKLMYVTSVARLLLRVATLNSIAVFTLGSVRLNVRYVAKHSLSMPLWQYIDGYTQVRDRTSVNGVSMSSFVRLSSPFTKSHVNLRSLKTQYDGLLGQTVVYSVKWGMYLTSFLYILFGVSSWFSVNFVSCVTWCSMLYQSILVLLFIYVLYKMTLICSGCTLLIGRVITGIITWKDCERK